MGISYGWLYVGDPMKRILIAFLLVLVSVGVASAVLNDAENYYSFDLTNASGVTVYDLATDGTDLTLINGATLTTPAVINNASFYDGANDYAIASSAVNFTSGAKAYSLWVYLDTIKSGQNFLYFRGSSAAVNEYIEAYENGGNTYIAYRFGPASAQRTDYVSSTTALSADTWYHVVVQGSGDGSSDTNYHIYVNGVNQTVTRGVVGTNRAFPSGTGVSSVFGAYIAGTAKYSDASIDEYAYYERTLSSSEISELYNSGNGYNPYSSPPPPASIPRPYDVPTLAISDMSLDASGRGSAVFGFTTSTDGSKAYAVDNSNGVFEYDLSQEFNISTATYVQTFAVSGAQDIAFKPDGTVMYLPDIGPDTVRQYDLSTPWDISTASADGSLDVSAKETGLRSIYLRPDGTELYITGTNSDDIHKYDLSTPWDITTGTFDATASTATSDPVAISFEPNGERAYTVDRVADTITQYDLSTPWDISTLSVNSTTNIASSVDEPYSISWGADGYVYYVADQTTDSIYAFGQLGPDSQAVELTAVDAYDGSSINVFNATINGSTYATTNGTILTNISNDAPSLFNIVFTAEDYWENLSLNVNVSSGSYEGILAQAYVYFTCEERWTNEELECAESGPFPRKAGSYNVDVNVTGYFSIQHDYNITSLGGTGEYRIYSETPTSFATSGSWVNSDSLNDDNWDTFAYSESGTTAYAYWNYTGTFTNVYWKADGGSGGTEENLSLSGSCQTNPQLRVVSISPEIGIQSVRIDCWDGASWDQISSLGSSGRSFYELGVGVLLSEYAVQEEQVVGFYDYNLTVRADDYAGNPESNFNITLENTTLGISFDNTASGETITYPLLSGYTYAVVLNATSTIYGDPVNQIGYANITNTGTPPSSESYQFNLSAARPITISLYYEENLSIFEEDTNITLVPLTDSSTLFLNVTISNGSTTLYNVPVSEYRVRGVSSGYHDEDRFIVLGTYTGSAVDLYFRENTTGEEKEFNVVDDRNILQNGWYVRFQRYYNDTGWVTVDEARSNVDGLAVENVLRTEYYRLILLNEDFGEEYRSERTLLLESVYQISSDTNVVTNAQINKVLGVSGLVTINPNTNIVTATGSSSSGSRDWKLDLYRYYTDGAVLINSTTTSGDSITLSLPLPSSEARYEAVLSILGSEIPIADNGYNRGLGPESFGTSGAFYAFALLIGIVGLAVFSAPAAIVLSVFSIIISNLIGVLSISIGAIVGLAIVGGIIIYRRNN